MRLASILTKGGRQANLVNDLVTRSVCQRAASLSLQSPLIEAEMETAADNPPVNAKWTPDEKNGSMKAKITDRN